MMTTTSTMMTTTTRTTTNVVDELDDELEVDLARPESASAPGGQNRSG